MSNRDCGRWYCQRAAGFRKLTLGEDVFLSSIKRADDRNRRDLQRERQELTGNLGPAPLLNPADIGGWFGAMRHEHGPDVWLAAYTHGEGAAGHYWVWDPDSREKYMEANGPYQPGSVPQDYGDLHGGLSWQLPLLCVVDGEPTESDLTPLRRNGVPWVNLQEEPQLPPSPPPPPSITRQLLDRWAEATGFKNRWARLDAELAVLFTAVLTIVSILEEGEQK